MAQHFYSSTAVEATLAQAITTTGQTTLVVAESATDNGWPTSFPFTLSVDFATVGVELIDVTSKGALAGGLRTWNVSRAQDFTVATTHAVGARIRHVITARDLREARQARWVQPDDTLQTYIVQESAGSTEFQDSIAGDLIVKLAPGKRILFGNATNPTSTVKISDTKTITAGTPLDVQGGLQANASGIDITAAWQTTTPTWSSNGTPPSGFTAFNRYLIFGKLLIFSCYFKGNASGFSAGTGTYIWNLNIPGQSARATQVVAGWADTSTGGTQRFVMNGNVGVGAGVSIDRGITAQPQLGITAAGYVYNSSTTSPAGAGTTYVWTNNCEIHFSGVLELN